MKKSISMTDIFKNPRYRGKHIILAAGKVYTAKTGEGAAAILRKIREKHPNTTPEVAYLPKAHSLTLCKQKIKAKIGSLQRAVPIAFFDNNQVPPLLGRLGFLETFDTEFLKSHVTVFKD